MNEWVIVPAEPTAAMVSALKSNIEVVHRGGVLCVLRAGVALQRAIEAAPRARCVNDAPPPLTRENLARALFDAPDGLDMLDCDAVAAFICERFGR